MAQPRVLVTINDSVKIVWLLQGGGNYTQVVTRPPNETLKARIEKNEKD